MTTTTTYRVICDGSSPVVYTVSADRIVGMCEESQQATDDAEWTAAPDDVAAHVMGLVDAYMGDGTTSPQQYVVELPTTER